MPTLESPVNDNPYASNSPDQNPYGLPPQNPYAAPPGSEAANPYASNPPNSGGVPANIGQPAYNPYAPPSAAVDTAWANPTPALHQPLAERGTRLGAAIVDGMLYVVPAIFAGIGFGAELIPLGLLGFVGIFALAIYQWYLISTTGQSLAKKWMGIRIVMEDGSPVDFVHGVLLRSWVIGVANQIIPFFGLVDALMIFGEQRRCLHDHIASTKVIVAADG